MITFIKKTELAYSSFSIIFITYHCYSSSSSSLCELQTRQICPTYWTFHLHIHPLLKTTFMKYMITRGYHILSFVCYINWIVANDTIYWWPFCIFFMNCNNSTAVAVAWSFLLSITSSSFIYYIIFKQSNVIRIIAVWMKPCTWYLLRDKIPWNRSRVVIFWWKKSIEKRREREET